MEPQSTGLFLVLMGAFCVLLGCVAVVIALVPFLPRALAWVATAYAVLVGWSRVYLGVHYPLDILGGAGIGIAVGGAILLLLGVLLHRHTRRAANDRDAAQGAASGTGSA